MEGGAGHVACVAEHEAHLTTSFAREETLLAARSEDRSLAGCRDETLHTRSDRSPLHVAK